MLENRISLHEDPEAFFFSLFKANSDTDVNFNPGLISSAQLISPGLKLYFILKFMQSYKSGQCILL